MVRSRPKPALLLRCRPAFFLQDYRLKQTAASSLALETRSGPALRVLKLHDIADAVGRIRRTPMPGLMVGKIDVSGPTEDGASALPFENRILLADRMPTGVVTARHILGGAVFDQGDVAQSDLHRKPHDRHAHSGIEAGNICRERKLQHIIDMPTTDGLPWFVANDIQSVEARL